MDEQYRLVFRGEVAEGQHAAVVKKRLATLLKLDDAKVEQLFGGAAVVLRRSVDRQTAAQFQAAFKKAGAKLRVQPIVHAEAGAQAQATESQTTESGAQAASAADPSEQAAVAAADSSGLRILPVGSLLLEVHERLPPVEANIPTSHLTLDAASALAAADAADESPAAAVNVDHLSVADVGAQIGAGDAAASAVPLEIDFTFELAEDGSWLEDDSESVAAPIKAPDYTLAEPGAPLVAPEQASVQQAKPPDVSHLSLQDDD